MSVLTRDVSCRQAVELVTDYLEGALSPRARRRLERHLAKCDGCEGYLAQVRAVVVATGAAGPEDLDPETMAGLVELFEQYKGDT
jgi:anti-sigma factor RsiW